MPSLSTLPTEIIILIISHLPSSSLAIARLTNRRLSAIGFPLLFSHIPLWLDYKKSHSKIVELAQDVGHRPVVMWSPWASETKGPVQDTWLHLVWKVLLTTDPRSLLSYPMEAVLTPQNFEKLSGIEGMDQHRLRTAQNRFLLHRGYLKEGNAFGCGSDDGNGGGDIGFEC